MIITDTYKKARRRQRKKALVYGDGRVTVLEAGERITEAFGRIWRSRREERLK